MAGLHDALMKVFEDPQFAGLSNDDRTGDTIRFLVNALVKAGHDQSRILSSGYLGEAYLAAEKQLIVNEKAQGVDARDKNGVAIEMKISCAPLGKKCNVNLFVPKPKRSGETRDQYYERLAQINEEKGNVYIQHTYTSAEDKPKRNVYEFSHEFITFLMEHANCRTKDNVNIGGIGCVKCTKVHRLLYLQKVEKQWLADKEGFDTCVLDVQVAGTCIE